MKTEHTAAGTQDVAGRLNFMARDDAARTSLRALKPILEKELKPALDTFYGKVKTTPETKRFFASDSHIDRAKGAQVGHWANIADANFNEDYSAKVRTIGQVHARARTTVDVERTIRAKLGTDFVKDPQVTVDVAQNRPFFILGEVRLPGQYPYVSGMTVETAVAIGGGYTERASQRCYCVTRRVNGVVDVMETPGDYTLLPGDTVYVYERIL